MYLPTTSKELNTLGWEQLDIILVTGDSYIDSPYIGAAIIGKLLVRAGYRVGIIAQPETGDNRDICRLGEPKLFWGISGGSVDSMVANYTATGKRRKQDDYTPGGVNNRRPDRAVIVYANLIRQHFKHTVPLVLGGIEASLRRIAHYDAWTKSIRRSVLFDSKADYLLYGMAEKSTVEFADALANNKPIESIRGICYKANVPPEGGLILPSFTRCKTDKAAFAESFAAFYQNSDPLNAHTLVQEHDKRFLVQTPPQPYLSTKELDGIHSLEFEREVHPWYAKQGKIRALDTIRFGISTHRGCYGECNFCAITVHQGRAVQSRSEDSIIQEAQDCIRHPAFKGIISDVGGPTANMYAIECKKKLTKGSCLDKRCLFPTACPGMKIDHSAQIQLLKKLRSLPGIRKVFIASGIRYDMILADKQHGRDYLRQIMRHHISGQMKIAPEHCIQAVLDCMGKPSADILVQFRKLFNQLRQKENKKLFLTYYIIAAHPGCTLADMKKLRQFAEQELRLIPEQVQIFTPTPSTWSTLMYFTGINPHSGKPCFIEHTVPGKERQKNALIQGVDNRKNAERRRQRKK